MADKLDEFLLSGVSATTAEIAGQFGVNERTVRKRRKRLRDKGLLQTNPNTPTKLTISGSEKEISFTGLETTNPLDPTDTDGGAFTRIFELAGVNQADFELVQDSFKFSTWQQSKASDSGDRDLVQLYSYRGTFRKKNLSALTLDEVVKPLSASSPVRQSKTKDNTSFVISLSDLQVGKTGSGGNSSDLAKRLASVFSQIENHLKARQSAYSEIVLVDAGDITEGFHNTVQQAQMNDLSLTDQLHFAQRVVTEAVKRFVPFSERFTYVAVPSNHCVDKETEVLTRDGWVSVADYDGVSPIAIHNGDTGGMSYEKPSHWLKKRHTGKMVYVNSQRVNHMVTPDHDIWGRPNHTAKLRKKKASDLITGSNQWYFTESSSGVADRPQTQFPTPEKTGKSEAMPELSDPLLAARFYGWYVSEGNTYLTDKASLVTISQSQTAHPEHYQEIVSVFNALGRNGYQGSKSIQISSRSLAEFLKDHFGCVSGDKRLPRWLKDAPNAVLREFMRSYLLGDGSTTGREGWYAVGSKSKKLLDDLQEVCLRLGWRMSINPTLHEYPVAGTDYVGHAYMAYINQNKIEAKVSRENRNGRVNITEVGYDDFVYCPTVSTGLWYARRQGKVVVTGNCRVRTAIGNKNAAGAPDDDYGILIHKNTELALGDLPGFDHVRFVRPSKWEEAVTVATTDGTYLGCVHGHQFASAKAGDWLAGMALGYRSGLEDCDVLLHGHWHSFSLSLTGHGQQVVCSPSLDNGSDWFSNVKGTSSPSSLLTFETHDGRSQNWTIWYP